MTNGTPAVILSGGSEIIALSIAEILYANDIPTVVIGMGKNSLLKSIPNIIAYKEITWPPASKEQAADDLIQILQQIDQDKTTKSWPVFPTEDGGLRFLLECREVLAKHLTIPGTRSLAMGGLDKAEFFEFLKESGCQKYVAQTVTLSSPEDSEKAFEDFGENLVFKPALRPFSMDLSSMQSKIITVSNSNRGRIDAVKQLRHAWHISQKWIAQEKLTTSKKGEALWWGIRTYQGNLVGTTAYEYWKYPKVGGSGCWVGTEAIPSLQDAASNILNALNYRGIAEIPFLMNEHKEWKALEFNPRPWLQIALPEISGTPLLISLYRDLVDASLPEFSEKYGVDWVNPERVLLAALSGDYGSRIKTVSKAVQVILAANYRTVYSTPFSGVRRLWISRMLHKIIRPNRT